MDKQLKKLQTINESSEAVFQEIFGFGKKKEPKVGERGNLNKNGMMYEDDVIKIYPNWTVQFIKTGSIVEKPLPGYSAFANQDWESEDLNWLANSEFVAKSIQINGGKVDRFIGGKWYSGTFRGRAFIESTFGVTNGDKAYFIGKFVNSTWAPSPYYFVDGTTNESDTILGLRNIKTLNQKQFKINIVAVVPGRKIVMQLEDGTIHEVAVIKRLDASNSNFNYRVKNGYDGSVFTMPLKWSAIRGNSRENFEQITTLSNNQIPLLFTDTFNLQFNSPIVKLMVTDETEYGQKNVEKAGETQVPQETPADLSKKQVSIELSNLPFLGIDKIPRKGGSETSLYFNFLTPSIQSEYNNIIGLIQQGWINAYIKQIKSAIDNGIIKGAPINYNFLGSLIGKDPNVDVKTLDKELYNALNGIESFLKSFVGSLVRRVRKTGEQKGLYDIEDTVGKQIIKDKLKALLGVNTPEASAESPAKSPSTEKQTKKLPKMRIPENETLRWHIKNILSEGLKHF